MVLTVSATASTHAQAGDFVLSATPTLTIAAGATSSTGTVTVTATADTTDAPDKVVTISATVSGPSGVAAPSATLTITDDEAAPTVTLALADASIAENGGSTTVTATLSHPSSAATTVTVTAVSGLYTAGADATIVIAAGATANAADTATIEAVNDAIDNVPDRAGTVAGMAANAQAISESETMTVTGAALTITDDDTAGFSVSPSTSTTSRLRTTEDGGTATFEVELGSEPTGDVVLGVASSDTTEGTVSASSLTFTATTWNTAQTVTLTGVDDAPTNPVDGDRSYTVTLTVNTVSTADAIYDALSAVMVYAVNADNEYGLDVGVVTGQATEAGGQAAFTVALLTRPSAAVTVSVSSRDASGNPDTSEGAASPSSLTFAATAWSTAQTVTVTGADDAIDDGEVTWAVRLDPSSGDANYDGLANVDVSVTTTDDDDAPGGGAGGVTGVDCGERRSGDGDGDALAPVGGGDDGDGDAGAGLLHGGLGRDDRDRGGFDCERDGHGDDCGGGQRKGRAGPDGDGDRDADQQPGRGDGERGCADADRRRRGAGGEAGGSGQRYRGGWRLDDGDGDAGPSVERGDDGDGDGGVGLLHGGLGRGDRDRGGRDGERDGHGDGRGGERRHRQRG